MSAGVLMGPRTPARTLWDLHLLLDKLLRNRREYDDKQSFDQLRHILRRRIDTLERELPAIAARNSPLTRKAA
jgi:hypothetical protein